MHAEMKKKPSLDTCSNSNAAPGARTGGRGREVQDRVGADDARLLDRAHGVHMVEAVARHQFVIRRSR
jgi:hypothetical protein